MITAQTSATGWTFLVARGRHTDYRTVLAPDFLVDARAYGILSYSVTQKDARPGETREIAVTSPEGEHLHVHYRNEVLNSEDAWPGGPDALLDEHGRAFEIVYGVVTRSPAHSAVNDHDVAQAREEALETYRQFLEHEDDAGVARSDPFALRPGVDAERETRVIEESASGADTRKPAPKSRPVWLIAAGAVTVAALAAIGVAIAGSSGSSLRLEVRAQSLACAQPLVASITTNGAQAAKYQWTSASGAILRQGRLRFGGAGSQQVSLRASAQGTVRLHVSASGQTRVVTFRC